VPFRLSAVGTPRGSPSYTTRTSVRGRLPRGQAWLHARTFRSPRVLWSSASARLHHATGPMSSCRKPRPRAILKTSSPNGPPDVLSEPVWTGQRRPQRRQFGATSSGIGKVVTPLVDGLVVRVNELDQDPVRHQREPQISAAAHSATSPGQSPSCASTEARKRPGRAHFSTLMTSIWRSARQALRRYP
jgi:hypothetical protein